MTSRSEQPSEEKRVGSMPDYVSCPFCQEADFDLIGLKSHYLRGWCDVFNATADPVAIIERGRQLLRKWNPCQKSLPGFWGFSCIYEAGHEGQCDFKKKEGIK